MLFFTDFTFPKRTEEILLNEPSRALHMKFKREDTQPMDDVLLEFLYGDMKGPPGDPESIAKQLEVTEGPEQNEEAEEQPQVDEEDPEVIAGVWVPPDPFTKALALKVRQVVQRKGG